MTLDELLPCESGTMFAGSFRPDNDPEAETVFHLSILDYDTRFGTFFGRVIDHADLASEGWSGIVGKITSQNRQLKIEFYKTYLKDGHVVKYDGTLIALEEEIVARGGYNILDDKEHMYDGSWQMKSVPKK